MIEIVWDQGFKRSYRKRISRHPQLHKQFHSKMALFIEDPFAPQLKTHKLSGKLKGLWAFSIDDNYRVLFEFLNQNKVLLIDFGTHDEVY
ncbi:MAG: type II toxin-antitoxin system YafQ family toxin [Thermodesulfobacteriota bacterium]